MHFTRLRGIYSLVHLGEQLLPVSARLFAYDCARRTRFESITVVGPAKVLLVMRLSVTNGHWNCPCNRQLAQLEGTSSKLIEGLITSLRVVVCMHWNGLFDWLGRWLVSRPVGLWHHLGIVCYCQPQLCGEFRPLFNLHFVVLKSEWFLIRRCRDESLTDSPLESTRNPLLRLTSIL